MMKFKSLFRRGQQNQQQPQQQPTQPQQQQQQQQISLRQAPSASSLEAKNENPPVGNWGSFGKEGGKGNAKGNYNTKGPAKGSRMQELEREIEVLRKERARLESNLRETSCDAENLHELRAELASLKVTFQYCYTGCPVPTLKSLEPHFRILIIRRCTLYIIRAVYK